MTQITSVDVSQSGNVRLDIQGLRAVSLLLIFGYHVGLPIHGGFVGLDVFFVISGFVIMQMLIREHSATGSIALRAFAIRRFRRLSPALAVTVSVVVLLSVLFQSPFGAQQETAWTGLAALAFGANVVIAGSTGNYFDAPASQNPLLNLWSLSAEEQFYLIFPLLMLASWWLARRLAIRRMPLIVLTGVLAGSFLIAVATSGPSLTWPGTAILGYYGAVGRAWEFAAGALLAWAATRVIRIGRATAEVMAWGALLLLAWASITFTQSTAYPGLATVVPVVATLALITAGFCPSNSVSRLISTRPMVACGDVSYSWYLWHWPFIVFAIVLVPRHPIIAAVCGLALSIVPAYISWRWIEGPIRQKQALRSNRRLALLAYGLPVVVIGVVLFGASRTWWMDVPTAYRYADSASYACHDAPIDFEKCTFGTGSNGVVALVGDSQALSLSDGVIAAASSLGLQTVVSTRSECPAVGSGSLRWQYENSACDTWQDDVIERLIELRPSAVVVTQRPYFDGRTGNVALLDSAGNELTGEASIERWTDLVAASVQKLRDADLPLVIVDPIPEAGYDIPPGGLLGYRSERNATKDAGARAAAPAAINEAVAATTGSVRLDPLPILCDRDVCPEARNGKALYADARHLSPPGALQLAPALQSALREAIAR